MVIVAENFNDFRALILYVLGDMKLYTRKFRSIAFQVRNYIIDS